MQQAFRNAPPMAPQKIKRNKTASADQPDAAALLRAAEGAGPRTN